MGIFLIHQMIRENAPYSSDLFSDKFVPAVRPKL